MDKKTLDTKHPTYDAARWECLDAIAKGGKRFRALIDTFLPRNPMEPDQMYKARKDRALYYSYTGAIINLYASWLFSSGFSLKAYVKGSEEPQDPHKFYGEFQENVGKETTLAAFMEERFREAMRKQKTSWLIELPKVDQVPTDRSEYDAIGAGRARLVALDPSELLDWEEDDEGNYRWAIIKTTSLERPDPSQPRDLVVETWRLYTPTDVTIYELRYKLKDRGTAGKGVPVATGPYAHGFKRVPILTLAIPEEMCIGEQTHDAQLEHFRLDSGLSWAINRTCYAMPIFNCEDDEKKPVMGVGYALYLGMEEKMTWTAPPAEAFDVIAKNRDSKRDEIFRIVHQMAQGLDNNAETVGRSADSKEIDAAATRIMLDAYGKMMAEAIEETLEIVSEAREETDYEWSVEGFSGYDTATAGKLLGNIKMAKDLGIPSKTFHQEISTKAALALVPEVDQKVKDQIRQEIGAHDFEVFGSSADNVADRAKAKKLEADAKLATVNAQLAPAVAKAKANQPKPQPR